MKKKILTPFVFLAILFNGVAATGKAHIPAWLNYDSTNSIYYLSVSNMTGTMVSVSITLYDANGTEISSAHFLNQPNNVGTTTSGANAFTLMPRSSKVINLQGLENHGWGIIAWTQYSSTTPQALIATSWVQSPTGNTPFIINSGKPF